MLDISEVIFESKDPKELQDAKATLEKMQKILNTQVKEQFETSNYEDLRTNVAKLNVVDKRLSQLEEVLLDNKHPG